MTQVVQNGATTSESYSYDPVGNRLSSLAASPWNYNVSNQLTSIAGSPGTTFTYDSNGNTTSKTDAAGTTTYTWDYENRLTSVTLPGSGGTVSFKYDSLGRRIYKSSSLGTAVFIYDEEDIIEETDAVGSVLARHIYGNTIDERLATLRQSVAHFYQTDGLYSVTSLADANGSLVASYMYDSFGNITTSAGSIPNPIRFTGRELDPESALYFYRARYYDSAIGRFASEDPIGILDNLNSYAYVRSNPTTFSDPLGLYTYEPGVPLPLPPRLDKFMKCMDKCTGRDQHVTATTNGKHSDPGHAAGTTVDLRPVGTPSKTLFCCAGNCGAPYGLDERKLKTKHGTGPHYHLQLEAPKRPNPKAPDSIPANCKKPQGCTP